MKAMTAKDFEILELRDFDNGSIRDSIYTALKEREELLEAIEEMTGKLNIQLRILEEKKIVDQDQIDRQLYELNKVEQKVKKMKKESK